MAQQPGSNTFAHRQLPPAPAAASGVGRLSDLLEFVRHEAEAIHSEAAAHKVQNAEYETHAVSHSSEIQALRVTLTDLEREHDRMKQQYEDENRSLRAELDALRNGGPIANGTTSAQAPPPQVGHGSSNLFGGLMSGGGATSNGPVPLSQSLPGPHLPGANGWSQRDREQAAHDHPAKRMRLEDSKPPREALGGIQKPPTPAPPASSGPTRNAPSPAPPALDTKAGPLTRPGGPSVLSAVDSRSPSTPGSAASDNMEVQRAPGDQKGSADYVTMFNPRVKRELAIELMHTLSHDSVVCCVRFSPDGSTLATGCNRNTVLYDAETGKIRTTLSDSENPKVDNYIRSACFSPDGQYIATGAEDRLIRVWHIKDEKVVHTFSGHRSEIYSLAFSPDGRYLASGSGDRSAHVWDMQAGALRFSLSIDDQAATEGQVDAGITSVAISPDGLFVAAGSLDMVVRIWHLETGKLLDRLSGHKDSVYSVAFAPDGKWLVSGSLDKSLKIWELDGLRKKVEAGAEADTAEMRATCTQTLNGHKDYVLSVAVSPDGKWIISGSKDRGVSFWDPTATQPAVMLAGHKNSVISIAVSQVGGLLATGSGDWTSRMCADSYFASTKG